MQKIQLGFRQEHVVYLNASDAATVAAVEDAAAKELDDLFAADDDGVGVLRLTLSSSSGSESIRITSGKHDFVSTTN